MLTDEQVSKLKSLLEDEHRLSNESGIKNILDDKREAGAYEMGRTSAYSFALFLIDHIEKDDLWKWE